jgi:SAM-dependent methyltransferase
MEELLMIDPIVEPLAGIGVELGAGCGLLSSVVARHETVEAMLAVEVVRNMATQIIPMVAQYLLKDDAHKVVPIIGSFDDLCLEDQSVDFIVEYDSLHHSDDLSRTLSEAARVLKPNAWLVILDRCHPNTVTDDDVERMLLRTYSREFLLANGYPPDVVLTRRENGEHEYRLFEWKTAIAEAGLELVAAQSYDRRVVIRQAVKGLLSLLPRALRTKLYQSSNANLSSTWSWICQQSRKLFPNSKHTRLSAIATTKLLVRK